VSSRPDEGNEFFSIYLIPPAVLGLGVHSAFNINECQKQKSMFVESRAQCVGLTNFGICEPIV
jgi:hypothetical protein